MNETDSLIFSGDLRNPLDCDLCLTLYAVQKRRNIIPTQNVNRAQQFMGRLVAAK